MNELEFRPWRSGDDLELLQIFGDPRSPHAHQDRTMLRENSDAPFSRTLVATVDTVAVGAGVVFASSLHPQRLWLYVEVAPDMRRNGVGTELVARLREQIPAGTASELKARYTVTAGDSAQAAAAFCAALGLGEIQVSRDVIIEPGALAEPVFDADDRVIEELSTGSVELTRLVMDFYNAVHADWDPAAMTVGSAQRMLLDENTGRRPRWCCATSRSPRAGCRWPSPSATSLPAKTPPPTCWWDTTRPSATTRWPRRCATWSPCWSTSTR